MRDPELPQRPQSVLFALKAVSIAIIGIVGCTTSAKTGSLKSETPPAREPMLDRSAPSPLAPSAPTRRVVDVVFEVEDGEGSSSRSSRRYSLDAAGLLNFSTYFYNVPIERNKNASLRWQSKARGRAVLTDVEAILSSSELPEPLADDASNHLEPGTDRFRIGYVESGQEQTLELSVGDGQHQQLKPVFMALISEFERANKVPKSAHDLPQ